VTAAIKSRVFDLITLANNLFSSQFFQVPRGNPGPSSGTKPTKLLLTQKMNATVHNTDKTDFEYSRIVVGKKQPNEGRSASLAARLIRHFTT
jgi:hypothetical protein